ncbi:hypothetical protein ASZ90_004147 [hydrocarbon metagenome]|uniref:Uncharacterized protein n=1 Tax=hydrocarbon metagenome TaxID=938273 RepID=A0A0W8FZ35_9ZZZZ
MKPNHHRIANTIFQLDILLIAETKIAPGALTLLLGREAEFPDGLF